MSYRTITARFAGRCYAGHLIKAGEAIGFDPATHRKLCAECWRRERDRELRERHEKMEGQYR